MPSQNLTITVNANSSTGTQPSDARLAAFPRPAGDNGRGLHFILDTRQSAVERYAPFLQQMKIKWATVYGGDEQQVTNVAKYLLDKYGIFSVMRVQVQVDKAKPLDFWDAFTKLAIKLGIPPYIQILNEPEDDREWARNQSLDTFGANWNARAKVVAAAGGFPGLQVLSKEYFDAALKGIDPTVKSKMFFALHNYGANHQPNYPYNKGQTVMQDDTAVLRFLAIAEWFKAYGDYVPPMLGGEGGWQYQSADDKSLPPLSAENWVAWHYEMFEWFRTGKLSNGESLPDYLFSVSPWLLYASNWPSDSWVDGLDWEKKKALIDKLSNDAPYVRQFGGVVVPPVLKSDAIVENIQAGKPRSIITFKNTGTTTWAPLAYGLKVQRANETFFSPITRTCAPGNSLDWALDFNDNGHVKAQMYDQNGPFGAVAEFDVSDAPPSPNILVDSRLTWITYKQGQQYQVSEIWYYAPTPADNPESELNIRIIVQVEDKYGRLLNHVPVLLKNGGEATGYTRAGVITFDQSGDSSFSPDRGEHGPYSITVGDAVVSGMGLPLKRHVEYLIRFAKQ